MSLFSVKNFVTPFTNTTHLVTIVLCTVLFAAFRLQGGHVSLSYNQNEKRSGGSSGLIEDEPTGALFQKKNNLIDEELAAPKIRANTELPKDRGTIKLSPGDQDDLLGEMIGSRPLPSANQQERQRKNLEPKRNNGGLDDIEKSLGLK